MAATKYEPITLQSTGTNLHARRRFALVPPFLSCMFLSRDQKKKRDSSFLQRFGPTISGNRTRENVHYQADILKQVPF